jgi:predicted dehydrogenase
MSLAFKPAPPLSFTRSRPKTPPSPSSNSPAAPWAFHATTAAYPGYPRRVEISGSEGTVILEHDRIIAANLRNTPAAATEPAALDENQSASSAVVSDFRGHQAVLEDFLQAIQHDRAPACDGLEGRRSIALIEAIYRAAKTPDRVATFRSLLAPSQNCQPSAERARPAGTKTSE